MKQEKTYSHEDFVRVLVELLRSETCENLLMIPGVFELVAEEFNNEVLKKLDEEREEYE